MSSIPIVPARSDWPSAIGTFLLNFGTLEYFVFVYLKDHLAADEFEKVKEWHLKNRLERIAQCLKDEKRPATEQTALADLVKRVQPMRELRNHIAHGHMYFRIDAVTKKPAVTLLRAKDVDTGLLPDAKHVEFGELEAALETLSQLIEKFERLAGFAPDKGGM